MDFRVCLFSPQHDANIILLAVTSFQVGLFFSITWLHDLTSLLNSGTTCAFQHVQLFWPHEPPGLREIELQNRRAGAGAGARERSAPRWSASGGKKCVRACKCRRWGHAAPLFYKFGSSVVVAGAAPLCYWGRIDSRSGPLPYDEWLRAVWTDETNSPPRSDYGPLSNGASGVSCLLALFASETAISVTLFFFFLSYKGAARKLISPSICSFSGNVTILRRGFGGISRWWMIAGPQLCSHSAQCGQYTLRGDKGVSKNYLNQETSAASLMKKKKKRVALHDAEQLRLYRLTGLYLYTKHIIKFHPPLLHNTVPPFMPCI